MPPHLKLFVAQQTRSHRAHYTGRLHPIIINTRYHPPLTKFKARSLRNENDWSTTFPETRTVRSDSSRRDLSTSALLGTGTLLVWSSRALKIGPGGSYDVSCPPSRCGHFVCGPFSVKLCAQSHDGRDCRIEVHDNQEKEPTFCEGGVEGADLNCRLFEYV